MPATKILQQVTSPEWGHSVDHELERQPLQSDESHQATAVESRRILHRIAMGLRNNSSGMIPCRHEVEEGARLLLGGWVLVALQQHLVEQPEHERPRLEN